MAVATVQGTALNKNQKAQALVAAGFCDTEEEAAKILEVHANREQLLANAQTQRTAATNATATANAAATASETAKQAATDGTTAANTAQAASESAKQASVDGTTAANAAETASETAKTTSGLEGFAANVSEAGSEATKQAAVDGTTTANAAETLSEEAKNTSGLEEMATNIAEAASETTEAAATDASAVANATEAVTEQAKAAAGAESTIVNDAQAVSENAVTDATRDHAAANLEEAATEEVKQGAQKKGIQVTTKFGSALKGLLSNKYVWIAAAIAAGIAAIVATYKHFNPSKETLGENLDEAKQKVQESTQKIEEMESELKQVQNRIAELKAMGALSVVDKKELKQLEAYNAQLKKSNELEKAKKRIQNQKSVDTFIEWFENDIHKDGEYLYYENTDFDRPSDGVSWQEHPVWAFLSSAFGGTTGITTEENFIDAMFDSLDKQIEKRSNATTTEAKDKADENIKEILSYLNDKSKEFQGKMDDVELEYTPNAKKGSKEEKVNNAIEYVEEFNDKLLLALQKNAGAKVDYGLVIDAAINSSRFSEAAKQFEKLKTAEDGTTKSAKKFRKDLYNLLKTAKDGSNVKKLADYLTELGMIDIKQGEKGITDLSDAIVQTTTETEKATQSNLLFADSYSKITDARKAFEEGLQNVETGTENYESFADSYEKAMELLNKGFDLDNGVLMAHVERLISDEQLHKLGYDATKVKKYLQDNLKGVFGDKETLGTGLIDKIKNGVDKNGRIYAKDKNGKVAGELEKRKHNSHGQSLPVAVTLAAVIYF